MPIRGVGRAAKRCYSLPLADARGLPDAMEHCSKRDATRRAAARSRRAIKAPDQASRLSTDFPEQIDRCRSVQPAMDHARDQGTRLSGPLNSEIVRPICSQRYGCSMEKKKKYTFDISIIKTRTTSFSYWIALMFR